MEHTAFSDQEQQRYQRHLQLQQFGEQGQHKLKHAHVLIIGIGGLGCPAAQYLAAAGIGQLTLVDADRVSLSNLQRQILFTESDIGSNKALAAQRRLQALNSNIDITACESHLTLDNAATLIDACDLVIDCTDNFHTRYLINDLCSHFKKPWVYSSVLGFNGQLALFDPAISCFRCLFPELKEAPDCNQAGVLGVVPGTLGTLQALEAIKYLSDLAPKTENKILQFSALDLAVRKISLGQSPECKICSGHASYVDFTDDYQENCQLIESEFSIAPDKLAEFLKANAAQLIDVRSAQEHQRDNLGGFNIPLDQLPAYRAFATDKQYIVYCQSGIRSQQAVQQLRQQGLQAFSLSGGMNAVETQ